MRYPCKYLDKIQNEAAAYNLTNCKHLTVVIFEKI